MTDAAPSSAPPEAPRDELLARAFIESGYHAVDHRNGRLLRDASYWLSNNIHLLGLALGGTVAAQERRDALTPQRRRDEFHALLFLQAADLIEVTFAMRNFCRRKDAVGEEKAFEEFICFAVEPTLANLPPAADAALLAQLAEMAEASASLVTATPPPRGKEANRPDDPNRSGQAGSPRA